MRTHLPAKLPRGALYVPDVLVQSQVQFQVLPPQASRPASIHLSQRCWRGRDRQLIDADGTGVEMVVFLVAMA